MTDLLALTAQLVDIPSVSFEEGPLVEFLERELRAVPWLTVDRVGDNLVARTDRGREQRLILAGHTDTVPVNGNARARIEGDILHGLGSTDMKGGLAVFFELARTLAEPVHDVTYVFYAREEVAAAHSGLGELFAEAPHLVQGDAALLGEPTQALIEAGCQGTLRLKVSLTGERSHTARGWMGRNAIHRLGRVLALLDGYQARRPVLDGCEYREGLEAVFVDGGVAGNVVPDEATVTINHRFAPDRSAAEAETHVRDLLAPLLDGGDTIELTDCSAGAPPSLTHPLLSTLVERNDLEVRAKLGWTDVARFAERGIPAANFGPGDATIAHMAHEHVQRHEIESAHAALLDLLSVA